VYCWLRIAGFHMMSQFVSLVVYGSKQKLLHILHKLDSIEISSSICAYVSICHSTVIGLIAICCW